MTVKASSYGLASSTHRFLVDRRNDSGKNKPQLANVRALAAHPPKTMSGQLHITEAKYFELRGEAFNLFNTPIFLSPASQTLTSTLFDQIRSSEGERNMQIVGKLYF